MEQELQWDHPGRESVKMTYKIDGGLFHLVDLKMTGCLAFLKKGEQIKTDLKGAVTDLPIPKGTNHESIIWREIILKIQSDWEDPVNSNELCHCRKVSTEKVDRAIVYGAHNVEQIRSYTSANTGCGTCLGDVQKLLVNRLGKK